MSKVSTPGANPVALIAGPTASGKSDLAVRLALALQNAGKKACVINADSAQVYTDLRVLSARPSKEEMQGVRHLLFGTWDGATACSTADWAKAAKKEIVRAHTEGVIPILVGGTGLYIRTLLDGIAPIPDIDPEIRTEVRALEVEQSYAALQTEDPERAVELSPGDRQRISRALEVVRSTGKILAYWQENKTGGIADTVTLSPVILLPERDTLYKRCDARFVQMMDGEAMEEVRTLISRNLSAELPVMRAIGVPEIAAVLRGEISRDEATEKGQQATRNYAKRQFTWLRHQSPQDWPRLTPENVSIGSQFEILLS